MRLFRYQERKTQHMAVHSFNYFVRYADGSSEAGDKASRVITDAKKSGKTVLRFEAWNGEDYDESESLMASYNEAKQTSPVASNHLEHRIALKTLHNTVRDAVNKGHDEQELVNASFSTFQALGIGPEVILQALTSFYPQMVNQPRSRQRQEQQAEPTPA